MSMWAFLKWPSRACVPSFDVAFTALEPLQLVGRRCARRLERFGFARGSASARCFYIAALDT
eukprot:435557-Alexandrium_andersonii.AAC.1